MSRLTTRKYGEIVSSKREKKGIHCSNFCNNCSQGSGNCEYVKDMIEKLADYEDLEEQGLLLKLPCKVGDIIYYIEDNCICEIVIKRITIMKDKEGLFFRINYTVDYELSDFGKTVFLTKEEAEQELKRLESAE